MPRTKTRNETLDIEIGKALRAARVARGLSQTALGEILGVTFQQSQKFESGKNRLSVSALIVICNALKISPMEIIGPHVGQPSELIGLADQITALKQQIAQIRKAAS